jgi:hypothetical protein
MLLHHRAVLCSALGLALVLGACSSATDVATLSDPTTTGAQAAALDSALSAPAVASFQSLGSQMQMSPSFNHAAGAITALSLAQPGQDRYVALARQSRALQQVVPNFATAGMAGIFPDTLHGSIYAWNTDSGRYTRSATTGGPTNGVRFLLYATARGADHPSLPLVQVGYADLLDESTGGTAKLHILLENNAGTVTFLDYTFSGSGNSSSFTASVVGTVTNGLIGGANKTLTFDISVTGSSSSVTLTFNMSLNNPAITVHETVTVVDNGTILTLTVSFSLTRPSETLTLAGSVAILEADGSATYNVTVTVNGGAYCSITGATDHPVITRAGGGTLTLGELTALGYVIVAAADVSEHVTEMFAPAQRILGL